MKYLKAFLPYVIVIMLKIFTNVSVIPNNLVGTVMRFVVYYNLPYVIVLCMFWIYFNRQKSAKWIFPIGLITVIIYISLAYAPLTHINLFQFYLGNLFVFREFNFVFYTIFGIIAIIYAIKNESYVGLILAVVSITLITYVDLIYLPSLDYNPIEEFKSLMKLEMYNSLGRSLFGLLLIPLTIFTSFLSMLFSLKPTDTQEKPLKA